MQFRTNQRNGQPLSILGYGCLRYTKKGASIDQKKAELEMARAIELGVNYFDTAYTYGGSEECLGKFLAKGYRDKVNIATKLPHYYVKKIEDMERYFQEQLSRLQTDHIEYYLMHMLNDVATWQRLVKLGMKEWIAEKKRNGQIENIGFSFHGGTEQFVKLIDAYDWDFCQIQYNYMDEYTQAGIAGLNYAHEKGLPVIIMEPLRGGRLVHALPAGARKIFESAKPKRSAAEWGLRWIWNHPQVNVILSGMNDVAQVEENSRIASDATAESFTKAEYAVIENVKNEINRHIKVPCTGCSYCMPCPQGVDIPTCFASYNTRYTDGWLMGMKSYVMCTTLKTNLTNAAKCIGCGKCEKHCPQGIAIRFELQQVKKHMETPIYRAIKFAASLKGKF